MLPRRLHTTARVAAGRGPDGETGNRRSEVQRAVEEVSWTADDDDDRAFEL